MSSPESTRPTSRRVAIARLAEQVVDADAGVGPVLEGGPWSTQDGDRAIPGVVVAAGGEGRVEVDLHLVAFMPPRPLGEQAEALRAALVATARRAGVGDSLGKIDVTIHDLVAAPALDLAAPEDTPGLGPPRIGGVGI